VEPVLRAGLAVGLPLERTQARRLSQELRRSDALARAARALERHDRPAGELDERLRASGVAPAARADALDTLTRTGVVDDRRFARDRAAALARRAWGNAAIQADLEARGVAAELIEDALSALDPEPERAAQVAGRRGGGPRTARYLAARGFDPDSFESFVAEEAPRQ
jgi:SOS response regulatory protein OraA/RecX